MKIPIRWLQEYVNISLPLDEIAYRLTMAGSEVKGRQVIGAGWENVWVGQLIEIKAHPNADRLSLVTVDLGTSKETVVTGAPNLRVGDKVAFAQVGAQLIDGHTGQPSHLKPAKIRGIVSSGMVCSEKELGISDNHTEILVLPPEAPLGSPLADYLGEVVFDLEVTPNRPDCLSVVGIAREVAALTGQSLHLPEADYKEKTTPIEGQISVEIKAPDLCPRYCASLITGVKLGESPQWLQQRLLAGGMRPINNIVDATNYVMLEYGQPLHAFDYDQVRGKKIIVRRADSGENIVTLDGVKRTLNKEILVIADPEGAVAVAGVMGGADSEVTEQTTSILLEAANFNPTNIHYTGRTLSLPSEACMRFERGIRPELAPVGLKRATGLIIKLAGGEAAKGIVDAYPGQQESKPILLSMERMKQLLGVEFSLKQATEALASLGFDCKAEGSKIQATPPYWRSDISLEVDLIEEVARIVGYDKIPMTMLSQPIPRQNPAPILTLKERLRQSLVGYGFQEIISYSLTALDSLNRLRPQSQPPEFTPLRMANPMTADQEYLRPNLRVNLLAALTTNLRHEEGGIRFFELGKIYLPQPNDLPQEPETLCAVLSGSRTGKSWQGESESMGFFDAKGIVEGLLGQLGLDPSFARGSDEGLHSGKQAAIMVGDKRLGVVGELHPKVLAAYEVPQTASLFEVDLNVLLPLATAHKMFQPVPRFPAILRDIALVVDEGVTHRQVQDIVSSFSLVKQVSVFDVYSGEPVPAGQKSLAYRITYQSPGHTLTDEEVNRVQQQLLKRLSKELGATLRG